MSIALGVNTGFASATTNGATVTTPTLNGVSAGSTLVLAMGAIADSGGPVTLTTPSGWTLAKSSTVNSSCYIWYKANVAAGNYAATATLGAGSSPAYAGALFEVKGVTATPFDVANNANGTSATPSSGASGTLGQAAEFIVAALSVNDNQTNTADSFSGATGGFTLQNDENAQTNAGNNQIDFAVLYKIVSSTASATAGATTNAGSLTGWDGCIATFKGSSAAAPTASTNQLLGVG